MGADNVHATKGERMYDTGSTTFMLICTMLVFLMTPGLAFFYGGLSRRKNVINTMLMCFGAIGLVGVLWIVAGWSLALWWSRRARALSSHGQRAHGPVLCAGTLVDR